MNGSNRNGPAVALHRQDTMKRSDAPCRISLPRSASPRPPDLTAAVFMLLPRAGVHVALDSLPSASSKDERRRVERVICL